jgi:hypothetical protein
LCFAANCLRGVAVRLAAASDFTRRAGPPTVALGKQAIFTLFWAKKAIKTGILAYFAGFYK